MTLREAIADYPPERVISIGASDGYFFIGELEIFDPEHIDDVLKKRIETNIYKNKVTIRGLKKNKPVRGEDEPLDEFEVRRELHKRELNRLQNLVKNRTERLNTYVPIIDREVIKHFKRISEPGMAYIVSGSLHGDYWSLVEAERARAKERGEKNGCKSL